MKQRTIIALILLLSSGISLFGQIQKNTLMLGGEIDIPLQQQGGDEYKFIIAPTFGYFIIDNLVIGAEVYTQINSWLGAIRYNIGAGPFCRYYVGKSNLKPFGHLSYVGVISFFNTAESKYYTSHLKTGLGASYFLIPSVSIEALIAYDQFKTNEELGRIQDPHLSLHFGFQIFIPPRSS